MQARPRRGPHRGRGRRGQRHRSVVRGPDRRGRGQRPPTLRGRVAVDVERARAVGARSGSACRTAASRDAHGPRPRPRCAVIATPSGCSPCSRPWTRAVASSRRARPTTTPPTRKRTEVLPATRPRVVILGAGPNRIGQGIEFDYACVHAAFALEEAGFESVMVNSNPETVSTDYDTSSRLYFEPLSRRGRAGGVPRRAAGGGHRPARGADAVAARLASCRRKASPCSGTSPDAIDLAEDRGKFARVLAELEIPAPRPRGGPHHGRGPRHRASDRLSRWWCGRRTCWAGRAMEIVYDDDELEAFVQTASDASPDHPVLIDRFLEGAIEVDVDAVADANGDVFIGGGHGAHRGGRRALGRLLVPDPSGHAQSDDELDVIEDIARRLARRLGVVGLLNLQLAVKDERIWVIEANPRASRTVPFVSKVIGVSLARIATLVLAGPVARSTWVPSGVLPADPHHYRHLPYASVKAAVLPFGRFPGVDTVLGPGDEVDRRGHGHRRRSRVGAGEGVHRRRGTGCRARAPCSSAWRTATSGRSCSRPGASPTSDSGCWRPAAPPACCSAPGSRSSGWRR